MAETTVAPSATVEAAGRASEAPRPTAAIGWWAAAGGGFVLLMAYVMIAWVASGNAVRTPVGPDPVPEYMRVSAIVVQVGAPLALLVLLAGLVLAPLRRGEGIPFDGLMLLAMGTIVWQDPLSLYTQAWGAYNTTLINFGSWATQIPGWQAPNVNHLCEPVLFLTAYMSLIWPIGLLVSTVIRRAARRWPGLGTPALLGIGIGFGWVLDLLLEGAFALTGLYVFAGVPGPKVFAGHYYQFPLFEMVTMGTFFGALGAVRYFRDDRGNAICERGIERLRLSGARRTIVRFLALAGLLNVLYIATYNGPFQWADTHLSAWPRDITSRTYFLDRICGRGTDYACPGPAVPIPRPHSAHLDPQGQLVRAGGG